MIGTLNNDLVVIDVAVLNGVPTLGATRFWEILVSSVGGCDAIRIAGLGPRGPRERSVRRYLQWFAKVCAAMKRKSVTLLSRWAVIVALFPLGKVDCQNAWQVGADPGSHFVTVQEAIESPFVKPGDALSRCRLRIVVPPDRTRYPAGGEVRDHRWLGLEPSYRQG